MLERLSGSDMLSLLQRQPWPVLGLAHALASAHLAMHQVEAPVELPEVRQVLAARINDAVMPPRLRDYALRVLDGLPDGVRLCHGDYREKLALVPWPAEPEPDDRLRLIFTCCHPALPRTAQVALTLRTDWTQIVVLYDMLLHYAPSPVTRLHRAIALRYVSGAAAALPEIDELGTDLRDYHLFHATRAEFLRDLGRTPEAREANQRALKLTANPAEQALLRHRLAWT